MAPLPSRRMAIEPIFAGTSQARISRPSAVARKTRPSKLSIQYSRSWSISHSGPSPRVVLTSTRTSMRMAKPPCPISAFRSEADLVAALQLQHRAGIVGGGEFEAEALDDLPGLGDLLGIRLRELAGADPQRILQADANVAAHGGGHRGDRELIAAGAENRPAILVSEQ